MRAIEPRESGYAVNSEDNVRIYYEVFGPADATRTIVFLPTWHLVHSRVWKFQIPYFSQRGFRVVVYDPRGNGKSDRPATGYHHERQVGDALAVFQETNVKRATFVVQSAGASPGIVLSVEHPELVERIVFIGSAIPFLHSKRDDATARFTEEPPNREGWNKFNAVHWREDYRDFCEWFLGMVFCEPHSTKAIDDAIGWALETTPDLLIAEFLERDWSDLSKLAAEIPCPALVLHGSKDLIRSIDDAHLLHEAIPDSRLVTIDQGGHNPPARDPVRTNELIHDFIGRELPRVSTWTRALARPKRAIYVSSPIGLGHAQRDMAIADELRKLVPDLQIDWLAQPPVTQLLGARGESIHPLSCRLASEAAHLESEMTGEHRLSAFQALREMDEILLANFFVFLEAVRETQYDVWICDEAWDVDHFLFENPELKTAPYVWLTDFVGYLPADPENADEREAYVAADYNAELINQMNRFPALRNASLFIGNLEDALPVPLGPGLPTIPEWTSQTHEFTGYVRYFDPEDLGERHLLRQQFGFRAEEQVAVTTVGGTATGAALLRRIVDAYPVVRERFPQLRLVVVCGPRIDPNGLPQMPGVEYRTYVPKLYEMLAAADVALVQGGLGTTMELVALGRPFLYFPLQDHFEQQRHVAYRLERYGVPAWAQIQFPEASPDLIAQRLVQALREPVSYKPVDADGARRAAQKIAPLVHRPIETTVLAEASRR